MQTRKCLDKCNVNGQHRGLVWRFKEQSLMLRKASSQCLNKWSKQNTRLQSVNVGLWMASARNPTPTCSQQDAPSDQEEEIHLLKESHTSQVCSSCVVQVTVHGVVQ
ncbi:hypothetical protein FQA47_014146 [Oryzias melastigma]|uniref:Uncharacterized protein n=1 Tax=Oryzias melastigma TaxID=30732 RepID=A0A834BZ99_ORYME|nr:hypothetical protein FQA47_014146 [Oryzias melastigma]